MNPTPSPAPYSERFQSSADVKSYESQEYAADSYSSCIWRLQQPVLRRVLLEFKRRNTGPVRLLDFACGSGRILSFVEEFMASTEGVDISPSMAEIARQKCRRSEVRVGNILAEPDLLRPPYQVVTSFRFLLNVENEIRQQALQRLRQAISPEGMLVVNVHGNSRSLRHPAIVWKRRKRARNPAAEPGAMLNEMSPAETRKLLSAAGFEIVNVLGFGVLPPSLYRLPGRSIAAAVDRLFAGREWISEWSVDMLYVCRPKSGK